MTTPKSSFIQALQRSNNAAPPVWMMRQAGRYHAHYQALRRKHGFVELCKNSDLAAEVAMGPIRDFDFDVAILFSDILFPLEVMGPSLVFDPGPQLGYHLKSINDLQRYNVPSNALAQLAFQGEALQKTRALLPPDKSLIGFVGGALTLYVFAVHGTHKTDLDDARQGLRDGRFAGFLQKLLPLLLDNMVLQAQAGCDAMAVFESCAGDIAFEDYRDLYLPFLKQLLTGFVARCPATPLIYYGKNIGAKHWRMLSDLPITVLGIDHHQDMMAAMTEFSDRFALQGNFDPHFLTLPNDEFQQHAENYFTLLNQLPQNMRQGWICGLGHGVTPQAREENVRSFVRMARQQHRSGA